MVTAAAAPEAGITQERIDDEHLPSIVRSQVEAHPMPALEAIRHRNLLAHPVHFLERDRCLQAHLTRSSRDHQVSTPIDEQAVCPFDGEGDGIRFRACTNDEIGLQLPLVAIVKEIYAMVNVAILHLAI